MMLPSPSFFGSRKHRLFEIFRFCAGNVSRTTNCGVSGLGGGCFEILRF